MERTKKAVALRAFRVAGSGRAYAAGERMTLSEGEFRNFSLGGLVRAPMAEEQKGGKPAS